MSDAHEVQASGSSVTFEVRCGDKFLVVRRPEDDKVFPGHWAFPGGKVRAGESFVAAALRECAEETGTSLSGELFFIGSYVLEGTTRTGIQFVLRATDDAVYSSEFSQYKWISSVEELLALEPRIPGIETHAVNTARRIAHSRTLSAALDALEKLQANLLMSQQRERL